jgi:ketosteroid isomerase-like protein
MCLSILRSSSSLAPGSSIRHGFQRKRACHPSNRKIGIDSARQATQNPAWVPTMDYIAPRSIRRPGGQPHRFQPETDMQDRYPDKQASLPVTAEAAHAAATAASGASPAVDLLRRSLATFLAKDIAGWAALCDEDVIVEFPFAPDAASTRIVGRTAIYDYLKDYPSVIDLKSARTMQIYATSDPDFAIAEWSVTGQVISNGNPYEMRYATFVTFKNGLIVNYREYWNPQAFMAAMNGSMF